MNTKTLAGTVTPGKAEDTGLVPQDCIVISDKPEGQVNLAMLDYSLCPVNGDEQYVNGRMMMMRARRAGAIGSLGLAAKLLKAQAQGIEIFPVESRGKEEFIMPLTELQDRDGFGHVACFRYDFRRWEIFFPWLGDYFYPNSRFVRRCRPSRNV